MPWSTVSTGENMGFVGAVFAFSSPQIINLMRILNMITYFPTVSGLKKLMLRNEIIGEQ